MSEVTREELVALYAKCDLPGYFLVKNFEPHRDRDHAALVEVAIEKAGKIEQYCEALACVLDRELRDDEKPEDFAWILLRVTPAQRTAAALVALGIRK